MSRRAVVRFVLLALLVAQAARAEVKAIDDAGSTVRLAGPAKRVITLAPNLTELLYEAGGGHTLVGTVDYSDWPEAARRMPRVGGYQTIDAERIVGLAPDLVLVWLHGNSGRGIAQLSALGLRVFQVEIHRIDDVPVALKKIGHLVGSDAAAAAAAERFASSLAELRARYAGRARLDVFYQVAADPLLTIHNQHMIADAIRACGGRLLFGDTPLLTPRLSTESVVAANPDVILTARWDGGASIHPVRSPADERFRLWAPFSSMKAVRTGQLWLLPGDQISRQGPRILQGVEAVCAALDEARKRK
jgi:iron complex transport system substrate-binding protein